MRILQPRVITMSSTPTIKGYLLSEETVLIWNAQDATRLRRDHRIVGSYIGALPTQPRQNGYLGLPLKLSPEETTLLLHQGVLTLSEYHDLFSDCKDLHSLYKQLKEEEDKRQLEKYLTEKSSGSKPQSTLSTVAISNPKTTCFSPVVCIHTKDPSIVKRVYQENNVTWKWPHNDKENIKYRVFSDLWERGYFLTSGLKYGCDYLVYPGDPAVVHSHFIAKIYLWSESFSSLSIIQDGRLAGKVKKNILLCSLKPDDTICYITLYWSGVS